MARSKRCEDITNLRRVIRDQFAEPLERLQAAETLALKYGCSERNITILKRCVKALLLSSDATISNQAASLRDMLIGRLKNKPATKILKSLMDPTDLTDDEQSDRSKSKPSRPRLYPR